MRFAAVTLLFAMLVSASCWAQAEEQEAKHHGMMHAMDVQNPATQMAKLSVRNQPARQELVVRVGPVNLPAHPGRMWMAETRDFFLTIPFNGWFTAYHPRLVNAEGAPVPNPLLHHVAFYNPARPDFLCPNQEEHVFGAGGEMSDWPAIPGFGYRVRRGDRMRISAMFTNPTERGYSQVYLEVAIGYRMARGNGTRLRDVYPAWFDVMGCGNSGYDLPPGWSTKTAHLRMPYSGRLLGVGGHLHTFGQWLVLKDATRNLTLATLLANRDAENRIISMPVDSFAETGGYLLHRGDSIAVIDAYHNTTGRRIRDGAMGIVVGYFLPQDETAFRRLGSRTTR